VRLKETMPAGYRNQRRNLLPAPTNDRLSHETDRFTGSSHLDEIEGDLINGMILYATVAEAIEAAGLRE
jgi:hypothetical protein